MADQQFPLLFSPIKVGAMNLRNRIAMLAHGLGFPQNVVQGLPSGIPGPQYIGYWEERARGGAGWIGTQASSVSLNPSQNVFKYPGIVNVLRNVSDAIHAQGACVTTQIFNMGAQVSGAPNQVIDFPTPFAPSNVPSAHCWRIPHQLTVEEIKEFIRLFAEAGAIVREGGYDAVEVHLAHGYLHTQFMSPMTNLREDQYGGSLQNRLRFPLETINAVREAVGDDFTVGIRVSADEFVEGGYTLDDMLEMIPLLVKGSKIDYINVIVGVYRSASTPCPPSYFPTATWAYCAAAIRKLVNIPVMCAGRINDPVQADQLLVDNQADLIGMCRALIADPQWPNKAREGRVDEIRKCIACNEGCWGRRRLGTGTTCSMNPVVGRENEPGWLTLKPADIKKKVMIAGGGPAGLEAARIARLRGHDVSLYEKGSELGGNANIAAKAPGRLDFAEVGRYFSHQMKLLDVDVRLNTEVTPELVRQSKPDALVVATGSIPLPLTMYRIPGADQENVVEVKDVLSGKVQVGQNVLVVDVDHTIQALSTADFLATQGKKVEVISEEYYVGTRIDNIVDDNVRRPLYQRLLERGVVLSPLTKAKEIRGKTVVVANAVTRAERVIENVDNVVYCCGDRENNALYYALRDDLKEIYQVGDCAGVRKLLQAVYDGAIVGRRI
ncbi:MAG: FAD-dependent oxidoreductase [Dehalococcoidia bacterium]|nr:FAD-dependent oxidoreductase [Dehalococcoidia bacterium]